MVIKITTGEKKGITIASTKAAKELRPTQSVVREAIVNMLFNSSLVEAPVEELDALDLYAGIGSVGIELLSNGVNSVTFVERDPKCIKVLKENIRNLSYSQSAYITFKALPGAIKYINQFSKVKNFQLIFADAPYKDQNFIKILEEIIKFQLLEKSGILVWECDDKKLLDQLNASHKEAFEPLKVKQYGSSMVYIFKKI